MSIADSKHNCAILIELSRPISVHKPHNNLIEVANDFVQQPQAFQALLVHVGLVVEFLVVGYGREHHRHTRVALVVQVIRAVLAQKVLCHVRRQYVLQQYLRPMMRARTGPGRTRSACKMQ